MSYRVAYGFTYNQDSAADTWLITHNLKTDTPVVDCFTTVDNNLEKALPVSVVVLSEDIVQVTWSTPRTGKVFIT